VVFLLWVCLVPLLFPGRLLNSDGDLPRHIRHGEEILRAGGVIRTDPFSFTRPGEPFVGFEYGSQVLLALAHRAAGLAGVVVLAALLIALTHALVARFLLRRGVDPLLAYAVALGSAMVAMAHWIARPHLVSILWTILLLDLLERPRRPRLRWVFALFVAWANLHGGFLAGIVVIALYAAGHLAQAWGERSWVAMADQLRWDGGALALAVAASFVTPYGAALPTHLIGFFGDPLLREYTTEFFSPNFHWEGMQFFLLALLAVLAAFALGVRPTTPRLLVVLATVGFALLAQRNVTLFAVTALPLVALDADARWRSVLDRRGFATRVAVAAGRSTTLPWTAPAVAGWIAVALSGGRVGGVELVPNRFDPRVFPIEAVSWARAEGIQGRLFHEFRYGGYLLYAWPEMPVLIDGGSDFYGGKRLEAFHHVRNLTPGWRDSLAAWRIDLALLASDAPMTHELAGDRNWRVAYCDSTATLLRRSGSADAGREGDGAAAKARCRRQDR
jgi:hypothetical protein